MGLFKKQPAHDKDLREQIYHRYVEKVYTLCRRFAHCDAQAKDFVQECFIEVFEHFEKYDPEKGDLGGWIYIVSRNHVIKIIKRDNRRSTLSLEDMSHFGTSEQPTSIEWERNSQEEKLLYAMQQLPQGYRDVVNLNIFEGKSHKEVGEILNISASTSRSQLVRAKKFLRNLLKEKLNYVR